MFNERFAALLTGATIAALVIAGCGGGEKGEGTNVAASSISKVRFINQANAICGKGSEKIHTDYLSFSNEKNDNPNPSQAEYAEFVNKVVAPNVTREIDEIRTLGAPRGDEGRVEAIIAAFEGGLENMEENPELAFSPRRKSFAQAIKLTTAYGLTVCGETH